MTLHETRLVIDLMLVRKNSEAYLTTRTWHRSMDALSRLNTGRRRIRRLDLVQFESRQKHALSDRIEKEARHCFVFLPGKQHAQSPQCQPRDHARVDHRGVDWAVVLQKIPSARLE